MQYNVMHYTFLQNYAALQTFCKSALNYIDAPNHSSEIQCNAMHTCSLQNYTACTACTLKKCAQLTENSHICKITLCVLRTIGNSALNYISAPAPNPSLPTPR